MTRRHLTSLPDRARGILLGAGLLAALLVAVASPARAEGLGRIEGRITDVETRQPLQRANVVVKGTGRGAFTRDDGSYAIDGLPPGTYQLIVSYIGYETAAVTDVVVKPETSTIVNRALAVSPLEADLIEVRPRYFPVEPVGSVSRVSLSREEIRRYPGGLEDIVRTVTTLPGVALISEGGRNDLLVRGGGPSENLYLVNGLEVPNINHFGTQGTAGGSLSFVNLDFVDAVEFSTGGFGAAYGDRLSSSLAIEMRDGRTDRLGGKATISATQFGLNLEGPVADRGSFLFSARKSYLDLLFRVLDQPFVPIYTDLNLHARLRPAPEYELSLLGLAAIDRVDRDVGSSENRVVNAGILGNAQDRWIGGVRVRRLFESGFATVTAGYNATRFDLAQADTLQVRYFQSDADEREASLRLDTFWRLPARFELTTGGSVKRVSTTSNTAFADSIYDRSGRKVARQELDLPASIELDRTATQAAGWLELERPLGRRLDLRLGARLDRFGLLEETLYPAPRLALGYRATRELKLEASFGIYYQSPSLVWLASDTNRGLRALRNTMSVVGADLLVADDLNLSIELYDKRYRDLPAGATEATSYLVLTNAGVGYGGRDDDFQSFGYLPLESTGRGHAYGVDLLLQKKFSDTPYYGSVGLTVGRSRFEAPDGHTDPGQFDQPVIASLLGGYVIDARWEVSGKWRLASGAPYTPVYDPAMNGGEVQNLPDEYLSERLGATHSLDIRIDRRWPFDRWSMITFIDIQNVYNYRAPVRPRWDFWEREVVDRQNLGLFPTIGVSAEF
ncbi:MAG: TonB-dependent receptor [Candidatus Eiseniibacteriota bacterium]|jgi:hypothetical protein